MEQPTGDGVQGQGGVSEYRMRLVTEKEMSLSDTKILQISSRSGYQFDMALKLFSSNAGLAIMALADVCDVRDLCILIPVRVA